MVNSFPVPMRRIIIPMHKVRGLGTEVYSPTVQASQGAAVSISTAVGAALGGPLGAAAGGAIAQIGVMLSDLLSGCGATCTEATSYANQAEPLLLQNLQTYLAAPVHYASLQAAALANFDSTWSWLENACGNPALGSAGQNCISQRQEGACDSKNATPGGWVQNSDGSWTYQFATGPNSGTNCWNWFIGYRDPIANDPTVVPDPVPGASTLEAIPGFSSLLSTIGLSPSSTVFGLPVVDLILLGGALLVAGLVL